MTVPLWQFYVDTPYVVWQFPCAVGFVEARPAVKFLPGIPRGPHLKEFLANMTTIVTAKSERSIR